MAFSLKTWVNRISEYPNRRKLTHEDGSTELVTVARAEGQISTEGNAFSAEEMNDLEKRIADEFSSTNLSLNNCLKSVSDGKSTVASAITAQGVSTAADAEFATMATNITTAGNARYNNGYSRGATDADNRANASSTNYKSGYNAGYSAGVSAGGRGKYRVAAGTTTVNFPAGEWCTIYIPTGLNSVSGGACGFQTGNSGFAVESVTGSGSNLAVRCRGTGWQNVTARWCAYGS